MLCAFTIATNTYATEADEVLLQGTKVSITAEDFKRFAKATIAPAQAKKFYSNEQRGLELLAELYVMRTLEQEALDAKLDQQPIVKERLRDARTRLLAQERLQQFTLSVKEPNYEPMAREQYTANKSQFQVPEQISASHILIKYGEKRDEQAALVRAKEVHEKLQKGEDFTALATEYSDDGSVVTNDGNLGFFGRGQMVKAFEEAAFAMTSSGELSAPVKSEFGYHIIRFNERMLARILPFDEVKAEIIDKERSRFLNEQSVNKIQEIRSSKDIKVNQEAVSKFFKIGQNEPKGL